MGHTGRPHDFEDTVDGVRVRWTDRGEGHPVILLHGVIGFRRLWDLNVPTLSRHCRTIVLDLPGFGESQKPDASYDLNYFSRFLFTFCRKMGFQSITLGGISMGAHVSLEAAYLYPPLVRSLILVATANIRKSIRSMAKVLVHNFWNERIAEDIFYLLFSKVWRGQFSRQSRISEAMRRLALRRLKREGPRKAMVSLCRSFFSVYEMDLRSRLKAIRCPALLVWGREDKIHPVADGLYLKAHMQHACLSIVEGSGHMVMVERPVVFNRLVVSFLRGDNVNRMREGFPGGECEIL